MSRHVVGEPTPYVATSVTLSYGFFTSEPALHKMSELSCDRCPTVVRVFDRKAPEGWTQRYRPFGINDLCPECSKIPDEPSEGTYA